MKKLYVIAILSLFINNAATLQAYTIKFNNLTSQPLWIEADVSYLDFSEHKKTKHFIHQYNPNQEHSWNYLKTWEASPDSITFSIFDEKPRVNPKNKALLSIPVYSCNSELNAKLNKKLMGEDKKTWFPTPLENPRVYIQLDENGNITASMDKPVPTTSTKEANLEKEIEALKNEMLTLKTEVKTLNTAS